MSDTPQTTRRSATTARKSVYLTDFGQAKIEAWASANGINFSAAIETLALLGLDDTRADYAIPALRATTLQGLRLVFNRIARLLSDTAIEAATARTLNEVIVLQLVRQAAQDNPDDFEAQMGVSRASRRQRDVRIRRFHDDIKQAADRDAIHRLRQTVSRLDLLLSDPDESEAETDDASAGGEAP